MPCAFGCPMELRNRGVQNCVCSSLFYFRMRWHRSFIKMCTVLPIAHTKAAFWPPLCVFQDTEGHTCISTLNAAHETIFTETGSPYVQLNGSSIVISFSTRPAALCAPPGSSSYSLYCFRFLLPQLRLGDGTSFVVQIPRSAATSLSMAISR